MNKWNLLKQNQHLGGWKMLLDEKVLKEKE